MLNYVEFYKETKKKIVENLSQFWKKIDKTKSLQLKDKFRKFSIELNKNNLITQ